MGSKSEKTVEFLRDQISILTALASKKQEKDESGEIKRLKAENDQLAKELTQLKENVSYYEVQNGAAQVSIPKSKSATSEPKADDNKDKQHQQQQQQPEKQQQQQQQQQQQKGNKGEKPKKEKQPKPAAQPAAA